MQPIIAPSLLAADPGKMLHETRRVNRSGAEWIHLDIMDGHFVPNLSFGPDLLKSLRPHSNLFFDVHLMCSRPETLLEPFAASGADSITVHVELGRPVRSLLRAIRSLGKQAGLALNPPTPIAKVKPYLGQIDLLLVMTVNPGFGGQSFINKTLPKIVRAHQWRTRQPSCYRIEVDGGIHPETGAACAQAGADTFVSGSSLFQHRRLKEAVQRLREAVGSR